MNWIIRTEAALEAPALTKMTTHQIIVGDSRNLSSIPSLSVQLIVTSPPYPMVEMWDEVFSHQDPDIKEALSNGSGIDAFHKMHAILCGVWQECDRVLADGGFLCINIGDATRTINGRFQMYSNHTQIITFFLNHGYSVLPDIHWRKPSNAPSKFMGSGMYPAGAYVTYEHEYILIFRKNGKRQFTNDERARRQKSAYFWEERNVWFSDLWEINGRQQTISIADVGRTRNASYPFEIPYRLVNMYSIEGDTVLDPFGGLGTTGLACMASQRNSISIDIDPTMAMLTAELMATSQEPLNRMINARLISHTSFIDNLPQEKYNKCYDNPHHEFKVKTRQETDINISMIDMVTKDENIIMCTYR